MITSPKEIKGPIFFDVIEHMRKIYLSLIKYTKLYIDNNVPPKDGNFSELSKSAKDTSYLNTKLFVFFSPEYIESNFELTNHVTQQSQIPCDSTKPTCT